MCNRDCTNKYSVLYVTRLFGRFKLLSGEEESMKTIQKYFFFSLKMNLEEHQNYSSFRSLSNKIHGGESCIQPRKDLINASTNCRNCNRFLTYALLMFLLLSILIFTCILMYSSSSTSSNANKYHSQTPNTNTKQPHIIWFIVDDLGNSDFSLHGSEYQTPNIDSLAYNGIQLQQHYTSPLCSPSRASFLTGRHAYTMGLHGTQDYMQPATIAHLPSRYSTIANLLKSIGYQTYLYGKWHLGYSKQSYTPIYRGFDHHIGHYQYAINKFTKHNLPSYSINGYDWFKDSEIYDKPKHVHTYTTKILIDQISNDIKNKGTVPLFMYIAFQNPHFPIATPKKMYTDYDQSCSTIVGNIHRQKYCRDVKYLDYAIGFVIQSLKDAEMYDDSLILMATDNGPFILDSCSRRSSYPAAGSAYPYRGGKYTFFQGGILTPAFIGGGKNVFDAKYYGMKNYHVWHSTDWLKTILHFTDGGLDYDDEIEGKDMFDILFDDQYLIDGAKDGIISDSIFFMSNREYLILTVSPYLRNSAILWNNGLKIMFFMHFERDCDVRSPKPGSKHWKRIIVANESMADCELCLFNVKSDPYERIELLGYMGKDADNYGEYDDIVKKSRLILRQTLMDLKARGVSCRPQYFNYEYSVSNVAFTGVNGAHVPFQTEDEIEWPSGWNY